MMKKYSLPMLIAIIATMSCSDNLPAEDGMGVEVKQISATLGSDTGIEMPSTKASLVQLSDPSTTSITNRGSLGWKLDVQIYKGVTAYSPGFNTYSWNSSNSWVLPLTIKTYFPNYSSQSCEFTFYPVSPNFIIETNQQLADVMLNQDKLYIKSTMAPAHILNPTLKHAHSMLDFTFEKIPFDIGSMTVEVGSTTYTPYQIPLTTHYLLILPPSTNTNPVVVLNTVGGAQYRKTVNIIGNSGIGSPITLGVNNRYVFTLIGYDLVLSTISILDWVSGGMVAGDYIAQTAYPTFRGPANSSCILTFDNGLTQQLDFNSRGEVTVKPNGRKITAINDTPYFVTLGQMIIDLNLFFLPI